MAIELDNYNYEESIASKPTHKFYTAKNEENKIASIKNIFFRLQIDQL